MSKIIKPQIRKTSELLYHSDLAPGKRYVFVDKSLYPKSGFYIIGRRVENIPKNQPEYVKEHRHNCNSFYFFIGDNKNLTGLEAKVNIENKEFTVKSPSTVMIPKFNLHYYKLTKGKGWFFHVNLRGDYNESLVLDNINLSKIQIPKIVDIYKIAEKQLKALERPLITKSKKISNPQRWIFVNPELFQNAGIYSAIHQIFPDKYDYQMKLHHHLTDEVYVVLGDLEINILNDKKNKVKSLSTIYHTKKSNHKYEYVHGKGLILIILKERVPGEGYKFQI